MSTTLSGSEQAMPILIINMGGEMLYILEQRLQAQAIVEEKSLRGERTTQQHYSVEGSMIC